MIVSYEQRKLYGILRTNSANEFYESYEKNLRAKDKFTRCVPRTRIIASYEHKYNSGVRTKNVLHEKKDVLYEKKDVLYEKRMCCTNKG